MKSKHPHELFMEYVAMMKNTMEGVNAAGPKESFSEYVARMKAQAEAKNKQAAEAQVKMAEEYWEPKDVPAFVKATLSGKLKAHKKAYGTLAEKLGSLPPSIGVPYIGNKKLKSKEPQMMLHNIQNLMPITQKAKGVKALIQCGFPVPATILVRNHDELNAVQDGFYPLFARPCPVRARHGFVDSRIVNNPDEAHKVFDEGRGEDPLAEMLLMRIIKAKYSAVITPGGATVGPGNDGATAGRDCVTFPLANLQMSVPNSVSGIENQPYYEIVYREDGEPQYVQLRDGPVVEGGGPDWVPEDVTTLMVLVASGDLLKWEATIEYVRGKPGVVVSHPGGSQTSHYAIHARFAGIPVITSKAVELGMKFKKCVSAPQKYNIEAFRLGVEAGLRYKLPLLHNNYAEEFMNIGRIVHILLLANHHSTVFTNIPSSWALGFAAMGMVRLGLAAGAGEARHAQRRRKKRSRYGVYDEYLNYPLKSLQAARKIYTLFQTHSWHGGFGGQPWADAVKATVELDTVLRYAYKKGTHAGIVEMAKLFNIAINQAHHNGWWLNKFACSSAFDAHAVASLAEVTTAVGALYHCYTQEFGTPSTEGEKQVFGQWSRRHRLDLIAGIPKTIRIRDAYNVQNAGLHVQYGIQGSYKSCNITIPPKARRAVRTWMATLGMSKSLSGSDVAYRVGIRSQMPVWLWRWVKKMCDVILVDVNVPTAWVIEMEEKANALKSTNNTKGD